MATEYTDPLERVLRSITNADHLRQLVLDSTDNAFAIMKKMSKELPEEELCAGLEDGSFQLKVEKAVRDQTEDFIRRWLIKYGYL